MPATNVYDYVTQAVSEWDLYDSDADRVKALLDLGDGLSQVEAEKAVEHAGRLAKQRDARMAASPVKDPPKTVDLSSIGRSAGELLRETPEQIDWLIPGVIARGWMVKVAAREKTGKGTLIAYLLGCLEQGTASVFGDGTEPVTALIYTEEPPESIREKVGIAGLERAWIVYGWELSAAGLTTWREKVDALLRLATEGGHGVLRGQHLPCRWG